MGVFSNDYEEKQIQQQLYERSPLYYFILSYKDAIKELKKFYLREYSFSGDELEIISENLHCCLQDIKKINITSEEEEIYDKIYTVIENVNNDIYYSSAGKIITGKDCSSYLQSLKELENSILLLRSKKFGISREERILTDEILTVKDVKKEEFANKIKQNKEIKEKIKKEEKEEIKNNKTIVQIQNLSTNEVFILNLNESNLKMLKWLEEKKIFENSFIEIDFNYNLTIEEF